MKYLIYILFGLILGVVLCNTTNIPCISKKQADTISVVDTVIEFFTVFDTDTVYVDQIKEVPTYIPRTVVINDTQYVERVSQVYRDSTPSYNIEIGAVELNYYNLNVHHKDTVRFRDTLRFEVPVIKEKKNKLRFSHGVQAGFGYGFINKKPDLYVGYGVTVGF